MTNTLLNLLKGGILSTCLFLMFDCSSQEKETDRHATADASAEQQKPQYGKIKSVSLDLSINKDLASKGKKIFDVTCTSCHQFEERYVGPGLGGVTKRRPPEYIMNMILDTETMIEHDDTVKCLLQTYLLKMPNMQVDEVDARNVLEHLRNVGEVYAADNKKIGKEHKDEH